MAAVCLETHARGRGSSDDRSTAESAGEVQELFVRLQALPGGPVRDRLRARLVVLHLPIARRLARRYERRGEALADLEQVAAVGLVKAIDAYCPDRGVPFLGYLVPTVVGELKRHFRDQGWDVHVPRRLRDFRVAANACTQRLTQELGRHPTHRELADALQVTSAEVREGVVASQAYAAASLQQRLGAEPDAPERQEYLGDLDADLELVTDKVALHDALERLPDHERRVLICRFFGNMTQVQVGEELGVSQMQISRLQARALSLLRSMLGDDCGAAPRRRSPFTVKDGGDGVVRATVGADLPPEEVSRLAEAVRERLAGARVLAVVMDLVGARVPSEALLSALLALRAATFGAHAVFEVRNAPGTILDALRTAGPERPATVAARPPTQPSAPHRETAQAPARHPLADPGCRPRLRLLPPVTCSVGQRERDQGAATRTWVFPAPLMADQGPAETVRPLGTAITSSGDLGGAAWPTLVASRLGQRPWRPGRSRPPPWRTRGPGPLRTEPGVGASPRLPGARQPVRGAGRLG